jgi:hypothetical protein
MIRFDVLLAALLVTAPTWWDAFVTGRTSVDTGLIRFLIAVPVCALALGLIRKIFTQYERPARPRSPEVAAAVAALSQGEERRRSDDQ